MEFYKGEFRISNIVSVASYDPFTTKTLPDSSGLNIEKRCNDTDKEQAYFVLATVKPTKDKDYVNIEEHGTRVIDNVEVEDYSTYRDLCKLAVNAVVLANKNND